MVSKIRVRGWLALTVIGLAAAGPPAQAQTVLTACTTISSPGNYVLGNNITVAGDCFIIEVPNVAIDFNGKKLTGNGSGAGIFDLGNPANHLVLSNGKIRNFLTGVALSAASYVTLHKMDVSQNGKYGIFIGGCCNTLEDVKANDNELDGITIQDCCSTVTNSETEGNGADGMRLEGCCHAVSHSTSSGNGDDGIYANDCCNSANDSRSTKNGGNGIFMEDDNNIVNNSTVTGNGGHGIALEDSYNLVSHCKVKNNGGTGIKMDEDANNQITTSSSKGNLFGALIACPSTITDLKASGNPSGNLVEVGGTCTKLNAP